MSTTALHAVVSRSSEVSRVEPRSLVQAAVVVAFALTAYAQEFLWPNTPPLPSGDGLLFLIGGQKLLAGHIIYRDFFELIFPGTDVFYAVLVKIFGSRAWVYSFTTAALGAAIAITTTAIASHLMPRRNAILAGLLFLALPFYAAPDPSHHWFSTELILLAVWAVLKGGRYSPIAAGAMCALATFFTQTKGVTAVAAFCLWFLWRKERRQSIAVAVSFAITLSAVMLPFVAMAGFARVYENTVVFVLKNYATEWYNNWRVYLAILPRHRGWIDVPDILAFLFVHTIVPFEYVVWAVRRRERAEPDGLILVAGVGVALFLAVASSPNLFRLGAAAAPAIIILVSRMEGRVFRIAASATLALTLMGVAARQMAQHTTLDLPAGKLAVTIMRLGNRQAMVDELKWVAEHTQKGQTCYGNQVICFAAGLRNPGPVTYVLPTEFTPAERVKLEVEALDRERTPLIVLRPPMYTPAATGHDHLQPFRDYLYAHYRPVKVFPNTDEVWLRTPEH